MKNLLYVSPAGNIVASFEAWLKREAMAEQVAVTYSEGMFELCERHGLRGHFLVPNTERKRVSNGRHVAYQLGRAIGGSGLRYHLSTASVTLSVLAYAVKVRPKYIVLSDDTVTPLPFLLCKLWGARIVFSRHVLMWNPFRAPTAMSRLRLATWGWFLRHVSHGIVAVSGKIVAQVRELTGPGRSPAIVFSPRWDLERFRAIPPAPVGASPFRLLYLGRIEGEKGVFDMLQVVRKLIDEGHLVAIDFCGDGGAIEALRAERDRMGLADAVDIHGHCTFEQAREIMNRCHAVVAPTRTSFIEGFNKTVIEAVLARRPIISSRVCPALEQVGAAGIEAEPDDWMSYADAIRRLITDEAFYRSSVAAAEAIRETIGSDRPSQPEALEMVLGLEPGGRF